MKHNTPNQNPNRTVVTNLLRMKVAVQCKVTQKHVLQAATGVMAQSLFIRQRRQSLLKLPSALCYFEIPGSHSKHGPEDPSNKLKKKKRKHFKTPNLTNPILPASIHILFFVSSLLLAGTFSACTVIRTPDFVNLRSRKQQQQAFSAKTKMRPAPKHSKLTADGLGVSILLPSQTPKKDSVTLPSTPLKGPTTKASMGRLPRTEEFGSSLERIRLLNKIGLRSPMLNRHRPNGLEPYQSYYEESVHTHRTVRTMALRIFSMVNTPLSSFKRYYDDFTTIDWAKAFILMNMFNYGVHHGLLFKNEGPADPENGDGEDAVFQLKLSLFHRTYLLLGKWVLITIIAFCFAVIAFFIDKFEVLLVGAKHGFCKTNWFASQVSCCSIPRESVFSDIAEECPDWVSWSTLLKGSPFDAYLRLDFAIYVMLTLVLALLAGVITLTTKIPSRFPYHGDLSPLTEAAFHDSPEPTDKAPRVIYSAAGSGVPEVKTILSGFVIRRFLGSYTLLAKTIALICAIASGMALGKEGPYVHLATCVGNIFTRLFPYINGNELLKKQVLSAAASSGVALAFGSPLGGVLFILEEINHYLPSHQLFLIFICAMTSTLFLKFLNPYGTNKTVLFELNYESDWRATELPFFVFIGIAGGIFGAAFVRFTKWWPKTFRQLRFIKGRPMVDIFCVALATGVITFWNPYTKQASSELVLDLATSCSAHELDTTLCPTTKDQFITELWRLVIAFVVKLFLTFITFGLKVPCGIYVPSMVVGALFGRIFGMIIQLANKRFSLDEELNSEVMNYICAKNSGECVDLGIYSMISAGAFMAGVTRMNITLVTILFELTSSYTYVLPIAIAIAVANWLGGLIEENSLYEALLIANDYPFLSPESEAIDPFASAGELLPDGDFCKKEERFEEDEENGSKSQRASSSDEPSDVSDLSSFGLDEKLHIDVTQTPYVSTRVLWSKLTLLTKKSLLDGCIPLIKEGICVGTIFFSELELCLDRVSGFTHEFDISDEIYCKVFKTGVYKPSAWKPHEEHNVKVLIAALEVQRSSSYRDVSPEDYFNYRSNEEYVNFENERTMYEAHLKSLTNITRYVNTDPIFINYNATLTLAHLIFDRIGTRIVVLQKDGKYYGVLHKKALVDFCRRPCKH